MPECRGMPAKPVECWNAKKAEKAVGRPQKW